MAKIYVSSTFDDLEAHRREVSVILRRMGHEDVAMEYYIAEDKRPVDKCLADVAACDLYVGLFAWRYGWVPKKNNRSKLSITEMEYRKAVSEGKKCLIFLLDGKTFWPPDYIDDNRTKIKKLREELSEEHGASLFTSADKLASLVGAAIYKWDKERGHIPAGMLSAEFDLADYYAALRKRYQRIDLEGLTPPQREEYLQLLLRSVFVEQSVRENPPPVELSKAAWEKLRGEKEIHADDLPDGTTLDDVRRAREVYYEKPVRAALDVLTDARHQRVIILGDPGSGKSTLARYVLLSLLDPAGDEKLNRAFAGYLPLLVELRSYAGLCADNKCSSFLEYFDFMGQNEGWHLTAAALHEHLKNDGRAVVIFDGLDEIFNPEHREQLSRRIVGFAADYPKARIIATSRVIGYRRKILTDGDFAHFTLQDLDESQVAIFVNRWYELALNDRPDDAQARRARILSAFKDSASIRQLAGNPMLLTIMAIIGKHQELPRERWKLYDHAASVLIEHWDVNKHLQDHRIQSELIGQDEKKEMLRRLADRMQSGAEGLAGNYIHREELQAEFESYLKERYSLPPTDAVRMARIIIEQFHERNFILSLYGANLYGFVHRAFLEYFCASAFMNKFEKRKELTLEQLQQDVYGAHWEDRSWHEVLRLICSMIDEKFAGEIIDYLINVPNQPRPEEYEERPPWNIALAVQCLGEVTNLSVISEPAKRLLEAVCGLFDHRMGVRYAYNQFLGEPIATSIEAIGSGWPYRAMLADWLRRYRPFDHSWRYAEAFGRFIGSIGAGEDDIHHVILEYAAHNDDDLRFLASFILIRGWREDASTLLLLRDRIFDSESSSVRSAALSMLAQYYAEAVNTSPVLRISAVNDESQFVRTTAVNALAEYYYNDTSTLQLLRDRAANDESSSVRQAAISALAQHYSEDANTLPLLRNWANNSPYGDVRIAAVLALAQYYSENANVLPLLRSRAASDKDADVRAAAVNVLAEHYRDDANTLPLLRDRAKNDPANWVRERIKGLIK